MLAGTDRRCVLRRKASSSVRAIVTRAVVTAAPRPRNFSASSLATGPGMRKTDCPIHTTPGRAMYGGGASGPASDRPKISWATRTERDRAAPATSYERRTVGSLRFRAGSDFATHLYITKLYYSLSVGWPNQRNRSRIRRDPSRYRRR